MNPVSRRRRAVVDHEIAAYVYEKQVNTDGNFQVSDKNGETLSAEKGTAYVWKGEFLLNINITRD